MVLQTLSTNLFNIQHSTTIYSSLYQTCSATYRLISGSACRAAASVQLQYQVIRPRRQLSHWLLPTG